MHQAAIKPERRLPALAISHGIGIGRVVFLHGEKFLFVRIDLDPGQVPVELERFNLAVDQCIEQLKSLATDEHSDPNHPVSNIFGVHLLILEESSLIANIENVIREMRVNSEWALKVVSDKYLKRQRTVTEPHFREKYLDIEDVAFRILTALNGSPSRTQLTYSGAVVVASELRPSTILELKKSNPAALITERGGWTSHSSILAREFTLPMVSGVRRLDETLAHGDHVIVDAISGEIIVNPTIETIERFRTISGESDAAASPAAAPTPTITRDGAGVVIRANVDIPEAYQLAESFGAMGIGLFRSESLIARPGSIPSEDEQFEVYSQMADLTGEAGLKIRTFDIGIVEAGNRSSYSERNPSLGMRSIRLSLSDSTHFRTQIRAILRAAHRRKVDVILPMISGAEEVQRSKVIIDDERERLTNDGISSGEIGLGVMIEVPSAVLTAPEIARNVDFFCLGTNDLVQYLLAVDRDNVLVAEWYQTLHPAVIKALGHVFAAATDSCIPVVVCGEMAASSFYVPLLIGLGARELSVTPNSIPQIGRLLAGIAATECQALAEIVKNSPTAEGSERILREYYIQNWPTLFPQGLLNTKHR